MTRIWASASRRDAAWRVEILSGVLLAALALPAAAQTIVRSGPTGPDVVVNESVIDALGPPSTLPGSIPQESAAGANPPSLRPFHLHPPRAQRTAAVSTPKQPMEYQTEQTASAVSPTAIPLGKPRRTAKGKSAPMEQASAATGAAAPPAMSSAPRQPSTPTPPPRPTPSASAGASPSPPAAQPAPAAPAGPVNSIVRRYPAGTGAAMLAASQPAASSPPAAAAPSAPATQAAAAAPSTPAPQASASTPPASTPAPSPTPTATAAAAGTPAASPSPPPQAAAPAQPAPVTTVQPSPPPAPVPTPPQIASLAPGGGLPAIPTQIVFAPTVTDMPDQAKATLDKVIAAMKADEQIRIQLVAYASGLPDQANAARRTSLSRAVGVRAYLVEQGVRSVRIDVRAMGNRNDSGGPQDRVDIVAIDR